MRPETQRSLRQLHRYLGVFFTPAILFFAISGSLQTFRLQEEKGYGGTPPGWIVWLAAIHKDQSPPRSAPAEVASNAAPHPAHENAPAVAPAPRTVAPSPSPIPLKIFVVVLAIGLVLSSLLGTIIALANRMTRRASLAMLAAGAVVPCLLIWI